MSSLLRSQLSNFIGSKHTGGRSYAQSQRFSEYAVLSARTNSERRALPTAIRDRDVPNLDRSDLQNERYRLRLDTPRTAPQ